MQWIYPKFNKLGPRTLLLVNMGCKVWLLWTWSCEHNVGTGTVCAAYSGPQVYFNSEYCCALARLLTRWAYSTITTVLSLKMLFVAHWTHAICRRVSIKSAARGTKHRHLAVICFLSHVPLLHTWKMHWIREEHRHKPQSHIIQICL